MPTIIKCAQCGSSLARGGIGAICTNPMCGNEVNLERDIKPNLEEGEQLIFSEGGYLGYLTLDENW